MREIFYHIATWFNVPEHILEVEKKYPTEGITIYVDSDDVKRREGDHKEALEKIKYHCEIFNKELKVDYLNSQNIEENTVHMGKELLKLINKGYDIIINISGGRRALSMSLFYASILVRFLPMANSVKFLTTIKPEKRDIIILGLPRFPTLSQDDLNILRGVKEGKKIVEIAKLVGKSQSTTVYRLQKLEEEGFITTKIRKRTLTKLGEIILNMLNF